MSLRRLRWLLFLVAVIVIACFAAAPLAIRRLQDIHPRNVTLFLVQIEEEYRGRGDDGGARHTKGMLKYVEEYYRYEDMPEHRGTPVAEELAKQRKRTMEAIEEYLKRQK